MSRPIIYTFQRGETVLMAIDVATGDKDNVSAISADLRKLDPGKWELKPTAAVAASFTLVEREAAGAVAEGWDATISAADSLDLTAGYYLADVRMTISGVVIIDDSIVIEIKEPATLPAA